MVWWTNTNLHNAGPWFGFKATSDVIYQSVNVLFDCNEHTSNGYHYQSLANVGVNIFNVDLTKHHRSFFNEVRTGIMACEKLSTTHPSGYCRFVGLSVTMSVHKPRKVDDRVDIIILKDITKTEELFEFRKRYKKFSSMPILSWPPNLRIEDLNELIKMSNGIVLDQRFSDGFCGIVHVLQTAKEANKPVFHFEPDMIQDYHEEQFHAQLRRILTYANNIVSYGLDGYIIVDSAAERPKYIVQSLVKAIEIAQKRDNAREEHMKRSHEILIPVLAPSTSAYGACMAAWHCKASAILVLTMSGASARLLANTLPPCRIIAVTTNESSARRMHLYKKVMPLCYNRKRERSWHAERWARLVFGTQFGLLIGLYDFSAKLVVLSPLEENVGYCDSFQIIEASDVVNRPCISLGNAELKCISYSHTKDIVSCYKNPLHSFRPKFVGDSAISV